MAKAKKGRSFGKPGSSAILKIGKRKVLMVANSSKAQIPGKRVPRAESPNSKSNTIPGFKKKHKKK